MNQDHGAACDLASPYTPAASLCLVRYSEDQLEYLILSDCTLVADAGDSTTVLTDTRLAALMAQILLSVADDDIAIGTPEYDQRQHRATLKKHALTNTLAGYWIASSNPQAAYHAVTGTLPCQGPFAVRRFALLTDGAARVVDPLQLTDWEGVLDTLSAHGPQPLIDQLRQAEYADAQAAQRQRYKLHDDASVIFCSFGSESS